MMTRYELTSQERTAVIINAICKQGVKRARSSKYGVYEYKQKDKFEVVVNIARGGIGSDYYFKTLQELRNVIDNAEIEALKVDKKIEASQVVQENNYQNFIKIADKVRESIDSSLSLKQKRDFLLQKYPDVSWSLRNTKIFLAGVKNMIFAFGKWRRI